MRNIYLGFRLEIPCDAAILRYLSDLSLWAAHREGYKVDHISSIEALTKQFKELEADGKKQKALMEMGFKPVEDCGPGEKPLEQS